VEDLTALLRRIPTAAWACAAAAFLNTACWSLVVPPFQIPDEPDHYAYVQELAQTGRLPSASAKAEFSQEEIYALNDLHQGFIRFKPQFPSLVSVGEQRRLESDLSLPIARGGIVNAGVSSSEPPLYYALETIPYEIGSGGTLLDRLQLMRLLSALMAGVAALFTFLFVREVAPGARWAWTVGALGVALTPLLGFALAGVNPEALLTAVSAMAFYVLARGFRRGLTPRLALTIGVIIAAGFLTKLNFIGIAPGIFLGLCLLAARAARTDRRTALTSLALASSIGASPILLYTLVNLISGHPGLGFVSEALHGRSYSIITKISYIWQLYLPRLPAMHAYFPGILTTRQLWFNGFIGLYGWVDTVFPMWVYNLALVPAGLIAALCIRTLAAHRTLVRGRLAEIAVYATMTAGLMILVGLASFSSQYVAGAGPYWEPRYFLPAIPLLAIVLALAARGAGRRWGPVVGVLIVIGFFAHDVFSQLQVIARYYG
jgi:4-amino-4-deoxy-L-arabinose transferase-like glycosyltransferase